jgi:hypothetical protein
MRNWSVAESIGRQCCPLRCADSSCASPRLYARIPAMCFWTPRRKRRRAGECRPECRDVVGGDDFLQYRDDPLFLGGLRSQLVQFWGSGQLDPVTPVFESVLGNPCRCPPREGKVASKCFAVVPNQSLPISPRQSRVSFHRTVGLARPHGESCSDRPCPDLRQLLGNRRPPSRDIQHLPIRQDWELSHRPPQFRRSPA